MDKYIFNKANGLWYELIGDYYFPCLTVPAEEQHSIGVWGQRHLQFIKEHHPVFYQALFLSSKLNSYLADVDRQAQEMMDTIIRQMTEAQGITEVLKAGNQMVWVGRMNNIRSAAVEIINKEFIYR